jgi:hypothetical protein
MGAGRMPAMVDQTPAETPIAGAAFGGPPPASPERPLPLRQMGIGELIDGSIKLYRRDWLALMRRSPLRLARIATVPSPR